MFLEVAQSGPGRSLLARNPPRLHPSGMGLHCPRRAHFLLLPWRQRPPEQPRSFRSALIEILAPYTQVLHCVQLGKMDKVRTAGAQRARGRSTRLTLKRLPLLAESIALHSPLILAVCILHSFCFKHPVSSFIFSSFQRGGCLMLHQAPLKHLLLTAVTSALAPSQQSRSRPLSSRRASLHSLEAPKPSPSGRGRVGTAE